MNSLDSKSLRRLAHHVAEAHASLTPLAAGFTHDGQRLPNSEEALSRAIDALEQAAAIARHIQAGSEHPEPNTGSPKQ